MIRHAAPDLYEVLKKYGERVRKPRLTVLFRRGEKAFGMFLILRGTVSLDFGVDGSAALAGVYGPGALVGLPATLTRGNYSMTATVTDDAELGFLTIEALLSSLREYPALCQRLLAVLSDRIAQTEQVRKALLRKERVPRLESVVA